MGEKKTVIHWFRKGLRIHDNPALIEAISTVQENQNYVLRPIYIIDPDSTDHWRMSANKWRFLHQSLNQLNERLISLNTRLYVLRGRPKNLFPKIFKEWNVVSMTYEAEIEPFNQKRDDLMKVHAAKFKINLKEHFSHTCFNPYFILQKNQNQVPMQYQKFMQLIEGIAVPKPLEITDEHNLNVEHQPPKDSKETVNDKCYDLPSLNELTNETELGTQVFWGGESEALDRMEKMLSRKEWIRSFEKPKTAPNSIEPSTTVLSPYITYGCLSSRLFYHKLNEILKKGKHSKPPVSLLGQLYWREYYYVAGAAEPNFNKMVGNKICRQIPWDKNDRLLNAWANGLTGYPFIDSIMRKLRQEGWIHHLARHAVACFLTRGDLWLSWEDGQRVFEELLLDADWALNAGNWMWLSASAFYYQYYRVYSPVAFGKKTDKQGKFIRKYCPELKDFPTEYIYEPWNASLREQQQYKCVLGKDYPIRIVTHEAVQDVNKERMKQAYDRHNNGDNPASAKFARIEEPTQNDDEEVPRPFIKTEIKREDDTEDQVTVPIPFIKTEVKDEPIDPDDPEFC